MLVAALLVESGLVSFRLLFMSLVLVIVFFGSVLVTVFGSVTSDSSSGPDPFMLLGLVMLLGESVWIFVIVDDEDRKY